MKMNGRSKVYRMSIAALITAVTCTLAPVCILIGPVPISLATFLIFLSVYLLGWKTGTVSCPLYIL